MRYKRGEEAKTYKTGLEALRLVALMGAQGYSEKAIRNVLRIYECSTKIAYAE